VMVHAEVRDVRMMDDGGHGGHNMADEHGGHHGH